MVEPRICLVTGGNRGIGLEVCKQLSQGGCIVVLTARTPEKGRHAVGRLAEEGIAVDFIQLDVTDADSVRSAHKEFVSRYQKLDILINNAGILPDNQTPGHFESRSILDTPIESIEDAFRTNTLGVIRVCQAFVPLMSSDGTGRIVNVSSQVAQLSTMDSGLPAYRISKVGLNAITRILADELSSRGILCNSVSPGWVKTEMGGPDATISAEEGAREIVRLATCLTNGGPTGQFFRFGESIAW